MHDTQVIISVRSLLKVSCVNARNMQRIMIFKSLIHILTEHYLPVLIIDLPFSK